MSDGGRDPTLKGDDPAAADVGVLPDRRELALIAVERTRMPMVITDPRLPDNPIVLANRAFLDLTGYEAEEVIGRNCRFLQGPDTDQACLDDLRRQLREDRPHIEVELLNHRKNGSRFWNQLGISPIHSKDGELIYYFASQKDITARRRAEQLEATERLLLKEVDHRAMNAMALVQSIVRLTQAHNVDAYRTSVIARVDALARAHRLLGESGWIGAQLSDLIKLETPSHVRHRVRIEGAAPTLPATLVQPLVLVLHELMTNAVTHGSLGRPGGTLLAQLEQHPNGAALRWREAGEHVARTPVRLGLGLRIAGRVIEQQLGGRVQMDWRPEGLDAQLFVPIRESVAADVGSSSLSRYDGARDRR